MPDNKTAATDPYLCLRDFKGVQVTIDENSSPLHVIQTYRNLNQEGYLAIPDSDLGKEYYISTYCPVGGRCQFAVTPVSSSTSVYVQIPPDIKQADLQFDCPRGQTVKTEGDWTKLHCNLKEFEVLYVQYNGDLSGTRVTANMAIAVVVGALNVSSRYSDKSSMLIEQIPPTNKWGKEFIVVPSDGSFSGDMIKITTQQKNTQVYISGFSPFIIPHPGQSVEKKIDRGVNTYIEASKPVLILQIIGTTSFENNSVSSVPSMVLIPAVSQGKKITQGCLPSCPMSFATNEDNFPGSQDQKVAQTEYYAGHQPNGAKCSVEGMAYQLCPEGEAYLVDADWTKEVQVYVRYKIFQNYYKHLQSNQTNFYRC